jgi:hypothetical protein
MASKATAMPLKIRKAGPLRKAFRRFQAKYLGGLAEGNKHERWGYQGTPLSVYTANAWAVIILACAGVSTAMSWEQRERVDQCIENAQNNRRSYYGRHLEPDYVEGTIGIHDGIQGYMSVDPVSGIKRNVDGQLVGPTNRELEDRMENSIVTVQMMRDMRKTHRKMGEYGTPGYQGDDEKKVNF